MHTYIHTYIQGRMCWIPSESPSSSELPSLDHTNLFRAPGIMFFWALELFPAAAPSSQSCTVKLGQVRVDHVPRMQTTCRTVKVSMGSVVDLARFQRDSVPPDVMVTKIAGFTGDHCVSHT